MAGIYIHIPFCRQACTYCDFHFSTNLTRIDPMTDAILLEVEQQKELSTLFRTNSFASKLLKVYTALVGHAFVARALERGVRSPTRAGLLDARAHRGTP